MHLVPECVILPPPNDLEQNVVSQPIATKTMFLLLEDFVLFFAALKFGVKISCSVREEHFFFVLRLNLGAKSALQDVNIFFFKMNRS